MQKSALRDFTKFTGKHLVQSLIFNIAAGLPATLLKKEALAQVFFCELYEIYRIHPVAASASILVLALALPFQYCILILLQLL